MVWVVVAYDRVAVLQEIDLDVVWDTVVGVVLNLFRGFLTSLLDRSHEVVVWRLGCYLLDSRHGFGGTMTFCELLVGRLVVGFIHRYHRSRQ